jgi:hypothetical protein
MSLDTEVDVELELVGSAVVEDGLVDDGAGSLVDAAVSVVLSVPHPATARLITTSRASGPPMRRRPLMTAEGSSEIRSGSALGVVVDQAA